MGDVLAEEGTLKLITLITAGVLCLLVLLNFVCPVKHIFKNRSGDIKYPTYRLYLSIFVIVFSMVSFSLCINFSILWYSIVFLIVLGVYDIWRAFHPVVKKPPSGGAKTVTVNIDELSGIDFENFCGQLMVQGGFNEVYMTKATGDHGADIIADDGHGNRWAVQCKRYKSKLSNTPIQEVVASKAHYGANYAAVITNQFFTNGARELALDNRVVLIDRTRLAGIIRRGRGITVDDLRVL